MKYCIVYVLTNIMSDEKISVGLVYQTAKGWEYRYSDAKLDISACLLSDKEGDYVKNFVKRFDQNFMEGKSDEAVLSNLENLHRYSNNYVIFSSVKNMELSDSQAQPDFLFKEFVELRKRDSKSFQ